MSKMPPMMDYTDAGAKAMPMKPGRKAPKKEGRKSSKKSGRSGGRCK